jgi:ribonuclease BN (tRNA processing enzyme)
VELVVLGSGGGWPRPRGAASGYLLRHDGFNVWLDAGTGTMALLQEHVALEDVHAVIVSHRHFDHFLDLYPFWLSRWWPARPDNPPPIALYAPPGMFEHAQQLEEHLPMGLAPNVVEPGSSFEVGPFRIRTAQTRHPVPTLGMRVETDGTVLAYSADTGPTDAWLDLAEGATVALSEATWLEPGHGEPVHLTASQAGELATRASVERLVLTHVWPELDPAESVARARQSFHGPVVAAVEGMAIRT